MRLAIVDVRKATSKEWDDLFLSSPSATFFQSREWAEIWSDYTNGKTRPAPKIFTFSDGRSALLPFSRHDRMRGLVRRYWLSPAETFGGWITNDALTPGHVEALVDVLKTRVGSLFWKLNPYDPTAPLAGSHLTEHDETQVLPLRGDFDAILRRWSKGHRAAAKSAARQGVEVIGTNDLEHWRSYFAAYEDSLRRWGDSAFTRHEWKLFEILAKRESPRVRLWMALKGDEPLGGVVCFYARNHVAYWHGAAFEEHFPLRPKHLLIGEAVRDAVERGHEWFDFSPSGALAGVKAFKKGFGAEIRPCPNVRVRHGVLSPVAGLRPTRAARGLF